MLEYPTRDELKEIINYNPDSGQLTFKFGEPVPIKTHHGYGYVKINSKIFSLSIIIWIFMEGYRPKSVYHINKNNLDNRWSNLLEKKNIIQNAPKLTQEYLKSILHYDSNAGIFTWLVDRGDGLKAGRIAGSTNRRGYVTIRIDGKRYRLHNLAWLYMTGEYTPKGYDIDHIDKNPSNNKWNNLRLATRSQNVMHTKRKASKSGYRGVSISKLGTFRVHINVDGQKMYLGSFKTAEEAAIAYNEAALKYFGEFAFLNDGKETL